MNVICLLRWRPRGGNRRTGKDGEDIIIEVPCGTVAYDAETDEHLCDITEDGQQEVLLSGGRGGLGNWHFVRLHVRHRVLHSPANRPGTYGCA